MTELARELSKLFGVHRLPQTITKYDALANIGKVLRSLGRHDGSHCHHMYVGTYSFTRAAEEFQFLMDMCAGKAEDSDYMFTPSGKALSRSDVAIELVANALTEAVRRRHLRESQIIWQWQVEDRKNFARISVTSEKSRVKREILIRSKFMLLGV